VVTRSYLSANQAAQRYGFKTANPILAAIRDGQLAADRSETPTRNGRNNRALRIDPAEVDRWAASQGLQRPALPTNQTSAQDDAPAEQDSAREPLSNVAGLVPLRGDRSSPDALYLDRLLDLQAQLTRAQVMIELLGTHKLLTSDAIAALRQDDGEDFDEVTAGARLLDVLRRLDGQPVSVAELAERIHRGERQTQRLLRDLEIDGLIMSQSEHARNGSQSANSYRLVE
jgi:hypothetical protein